MSVCKVDPIPREMPRASLVVDTLTGKRGISVGADAPVFNDDGTFSVNVEYYQHGLSSAFWACSGRRTTDGWKIESCNLEWIS